MKETTKLIDSNKDPIILFKKWFEEAKKKEVNDPNAMTLATISQSSKLSLRVVLLKSFDEKGFVFYTNDKSKKGKSINLNPQVALNFYWKSLCRQVRIEGSVIQASDEEADKYFNSRPEGSKIGAWASKQSSTLKTREELENKFQYYNQKYKGKVIPRPYYWKGFKVTPHLIEFWQEMPFRLHDRVEYKKKDKSWLIKRLYP